MLLAGVHQLQQPPEGIPVGQGNGGLARGRGPLHRHRYRQAALPQGVMADPVQYPHRFLCKQAFDRYFSAGLARWQAKVSAKGTGVGPVRRRGARAVAGLAVGLAMGLAGAGAAGAAVVPTNAPGGLVAPAGTAVGVAAAAITYDFRTGRRGYLAIAPEVTATYTLENPTDTAVAVPVAVLYHGALGSPYHGEEFTIIWQGRETRLRAEPAPAGQGAPAGLGPVELRYLEPATGRTAATATAAPAFVAHTLMTVTMPARARATLTLRYRHAYTACARCGAREPDWYWTVPLAAQGGWAFFHRLQVTALVPPDVDFATDPALAPGAGPGPGERAFSAEFSALPAGLHMAALLHLPPRIYQDWPWYAAAGSIIGLALLWQYRSAARRQRAI